VQQNQAPAAATFWRLGVKSNPGPEAGFEVACNLRDFGFAIGIDTPGNTPSQRWLPPDVVGCRFMPILLAFWSLPLLQINVHALTGGSRTRKRSFDALYG
jgi:hypothetical protein